ASLPARLAARIASVSVARQSWSVSLTRRKTSPSRLRVPREFSKDATLTTQPLAPPSDQVEKASAQCSPGQVPSITIAPEWTERLTARITPVPVPVPAPGRAGAGAE